LFDEEEEVLAHGAVEVEYERQRDLKVKIVLADLLEKRKILLGDLVGMLGTGGFVCVLVYGVAHLNEQPVVEF